MKHSALLPAPLAPPSVRGARSLLLVAPALLVVAFGVELGASPARLLIAGTLAALPAQLPLVMRSAIGSVASGTAIGALAGAGLGVATARHGADGLFLGLALGAAVGAGWGAVGGQYALGRRFGLLEAPPRALVGLAALGALVAPLARLVGLLSGWRASGSAVLLLGSLLLAVTMVGWARRWERWWRDARDGQLAAAHLVPWTRDEAPAAAQAFPAQEPFDRPGWWSSCFLEGRGAEPRLVLRGQATAEGYRSEPREPAWVQLGTAPGAPGWAQMVLLVGYTMAVALAIVGIGSFALASIALVAFSGPNTY